jgi:hypothetical protein
MITEEQISELAHDYSDLKQQQSLGTFTNDDLMIMNHAYIFGMKKAISLLQPEWISIDAEEKPRKFTSILFRTPHDAHVSGYYTGSEFIPHANIYDDIIEWSYILPELPKTD